MTIRILTRAALVSAGALWAAILPAQTVYRCGNAYSQTPCPGGVAIDASDRRSPEQKAQSDAAARQAAASAEKMARERLALEKSRNGAPVRKQASATPGKPRARDGSGETGKPEARRKSGRREPEYFTAAVRPEEKEARKTTRPPTSPGDGKASGPTAGP